MALFGSGETKEDKQARKEQEIMEKYGLESLDQRERESVKKIVQDLVGTGMMETGMKLSMAKASEALPVYYLRSIMEQNWIMIRQLDKIAKLLEDK